MQSVVFTLNSFSSILSFSEFESVCIPLRLTNCLFPIPDSQRMANELFQSPLYRFRTVFCSISHLLHHFLSSALV